MSAEWVESPTWKRGGIWRSYSLTAEGETVELSHVPPSPLGNEARWAVSVHTEDLVMPDITDSLAQAAALPLVISRLREIADRLERAL